MTFGERLRTARKYAGLTQAGLAEAVGNIISQQGIAHLEKSPDATGSMFTAQLAEACGVRAMWLACEQGEMVEIGLYIDDPRLRKALADPKRVNAMLLMESLPDYAVDHVLKEIAETQELITQTEQKRMA